MTIDAVFSRRRGSYQCELSIKNSYKNVRPTLRSGVRDSRTANNSGRHTQDQNKYRFNYFFLWKKIYKKQYVPMDAKKIKQASCTRPTATESSENCSFILQNVANFFGFLFLSASADRYFALLNKSLHFFRFIRVISSFRFCPLLYTHFFVNIFIFIFSTSINLKGSRRFRKSFIFVFLFF